MNSVSKYIELLIQMLEIPSLSRQESERADFLQDWLLKEGFCLQRKANNLVITKGHDPQQTRIMLNSHIDTVPPAEGWHTDPFVPDFKNNRVTGLGSNDAGGSVVSMIAAYSNLVEMGLADTAVLVISAEEEVSGVNGLSMVIPDLPNLQLAIVGEPTSLQPAVAERGLMVVDARANGTAGHAARNEGDNAIYKAMADIDALCQMIFTKRSKWLNPPSVNVTMIRAGTGHNIVPASCEFVIDVRSNDCYTNEEILDIFRAKCQSELIPRSTRLKSSFLSEEHFLFEVLADLQLKPFGSPTLSDMALLEVPAIKIGPGESSRSHTANEYIGHKEISAAIGLYTLLLEKTINRLQ